MSTETVKTTTYVTYDLPGFFMPEQYTRIVEQRDSQAAANAAPDGAYAFTFHDIVGATVNGTTLTSQPVHRSGRYFIGGTVRNATEVEAMPGDHSILLSNMRNNGWNRVIFCLTGNVQPFTDGDNLVLVTR
jgi:hypothetical protein